MRAVCALCALPAVLHEDKSDGRDLCMQHAISDAKSAVLRQIRKHTRHTDSENDEINDAVGHRRKRVAQASAEKTQPEKTQPAPTSDPTTEAIHMISLSTMDLSRDFETTTTALQTTTTALQSTTSALQTTTAALQTRTTALQSTASDHTVRIEQAERSIVAQQQETQQFTEQLATLWGETAAMRTESATRAEQLQSTTSALQGTVAQLSTQVTQIFHVVAENAVQLRRITELVQTLATAVATATVTPQAVAVTPQPAAVTPQPATAAATATTTTTAATAATETESATTTTTAARQRVRNVRRRAPPVIVRRGAVRRDVEMRHHVDSSSSSDSSEAEVDTPPVIARAGATAHREHHTVTHAQPNNDDQQLDRFEQGLARIHDAIDDTLTRLSNPAQRQQRESTRSQRRASFRTLLAATAHRDAQPRTQQMEGQVVPPVVVPVDEPVDGRYECGVCYERYMPVFYDDEILDNESAVMTLPDLIAAGVTADRLANDEIVRMPCTTTAAPHYCCIGCLRRAYSDPTVSNARTPLPLCPVGCGRVADAGVYRHTIPVLRGLGLDAGIFESLQRNIRRNTGAGIADECVVCHNMVELPNLPSEGVYCQQHIVRCDGGHSYCFVCRTPCDDARATSCTQCRTTSVPPVFGFIRHPTEHRMLRAPEVTVEQITEYLERCVSIAPRVRGSNGVAMKRVLQIPVHHCVGCGGYLSRAAACMHMTCTACLTQHCASCGISAAIDASTASTHFHTHYRTADVHGIGGTPLDQREWCLQYASRLRGLGFRCTDMCENDANDAHASSCSAPPHQLGRRRFIVFTASLRVLAFVFWWLRGDDAVDNRDRYASAPMVVRPTPSWLRTVESRHASNVLADIIERLNRLDASKPLRDLLRLLVGELRGQRSGAAANFELLLHMERCDLVTASYTYAMRIAS